MAFPDTPDPLEVLLRNLYFAMVHYPDGHPNLDGKIASTLSVASLSYTSNDADAQMLLPTGWSWSSSPLSSGMYYCIRNSDGQWTGDVGRADPTTGEEVLFTVSAAMGRCVAAVAARILDQESQWVLIS